MAHTIIIRLRLLLRETDYNGPRGTVRAYRQIGGRGVAAPFQAAVCAPFPAET